MPIIFAQAIMFLPLTIAGFASTETLTGFAAVFTDYNGFWYNFTFMILIIFFTYFYTAITINPNQMAEDMKKNGGFIPGVKPGKKTAEFIDNVMSRITFRDQFSWICGYHASTGTTGRRYFTVCTVLWRYIPADPRGCCTGYLAAN